MDPAMGVVVDKTGGGCSDDLPSEYPLAGLSRELRVRAGLPPDPPPPYVAISEDVCRVDRSALRMGVLAVAVTCVVVLSLYFLAPQAAPMGVLILILLRAVVWGQRRRP